MKKLLIIFLPLLSIFFLFTGCGSSSDVSPTTGTVQLEATCATTPFNVRYTIGELFTDDGVQEFTFVSNTSSWNTEFEEVAGEKIFLQIDVGPPGWSQDSAVYSTLNIWFKDNLQSSYEGVTEFEDISCIIQ